jgi:hypothetical protein
VWWQPLFSLSFSLVPGENIGIVISKDEMGEASPGGNNNTLWQSSSAMKQFDSHGIPT